VKPAPFTYLDPGSIDEVLDALARSGDDAAVIAGGQSLLPLMNLRLARPEVLVDPRRVTGLDGIVVSGTEVRIGAMTTATDVLEHAAVGAALPGLTEALRCVGHPQIRNRTTIGGSLAHADPAAELPAVLLGLHGSVELRSTEGTRVVGADDLFDGAFSTTRRADELLTEVTLPVPPGATGWAEVSRRAGDFALAGLFASVHVVDGVVAAARLALSGVADRPLRAVAAESALVGRAPDAEALAATARALRDELDPPDDAHASGAHRSAVAASLVTTLLPRLLPSAT